MDGAATSLDRESRESSGVEQGGEKVGIQFCTLSTPCIVGGTAYGT